MSLTWIGDDGVTIALDGTTGVLATAGVLGIDAPPVELNMAPLMSSDGSVLVKERKAIRRVVLPLLITGTGVAAGGARVPMAALLRSMIGGGTLRYTGFHIRDLLDVRYESGAEQGSFGLDDGVFNDELFAVSLLAFDPWWYGSTQSTSLTFAAAVTFNSASTTFNAAIGFDGSDANPVTILGDASVFPTITITGPFTTLLVGFAGGQTFTLAAPLAAGSTIIVDSRPGNRGPRLNAGPIDWSLLTAASRLWEIPVGFSVLNAAATGNTGGSWVEVSWRQRWLTP